MPDDQGGSDGSGSGSGGGGGGGGGDKVASASGRQSSLPILAAFLVAFFVFSL